MSVRSVNGFRGRVRQTRIGRDMQGRQELVRLTVNSAKSAVRHGHRLTRHSKQEIVLIKYSGSSHASTTIPCYEHRMHALAITLATRRLALSALAYGGVRFILEANSPARDQSLTPHGSKSADNWAKEGEPD